MNAHALKQTSVTPTLCVTILKGPMSVIVLVVIRVMDETVQVNIIRASFPVKINHVPSEGYYSIIIALLRRIGDVELESLCLDMYCACSCAQQREQFLRRAREL